MEADTREAALAFLRNHKTGALATLSPDGVQPHVRLVYYAADDTFALYFVTLVTTRKAWDLKEHARAAFVVSDEAVPRTVQIEGTVADVTDIATAEDPNIKTLLDALASNANYYAPIARMDQADARYYKLTPDWVRFGDFTEGRHTDAVLKEVTP